MIIFPHPLPPPRYQKISKKKAKIKQTIEKKEIEQSKTQRVQRDHRVYFVLSNYSIALTLTKWLFCNKWRVLQRATAYQCAKKKKILEYGVLTRIAKCTIEPLHLWLGENNWRDHGTILRERGSKFLMQNNVFRHDRKTTTMKCQQYDVLNENYIIRTPICMPRWTGQFYKVLHLEM